MHSILQKKVVSAQKPSSRKITAVKKATLSQKGQNHTVSDVPGTICVSSKNFIKPMQNSKKVHIHRVLNLPESKRVEVHKDAIEINLQKKQEVNALKRALMQGNGQISASSSNLNKKSLR